MKTYIVPERGTSDEYLQHMFSWRNKKNVNTFSLGYQYFSGEKKNALSGVMSCFLLFYPRYLCISIVLTCNELFGQQTYIVVCLQGVG